MAITLVLSIFTDHHSFILKQTKHKSAQH